MDPVVQKVLERLQASPFRVVVISTGGGAQGISWLCKLPGSSQTLLETNVPYGQAALARRVGYSPEKFVSHELAEALAHQAYERARILAPYDSFPFWAWVLRHPWPPSILNGVSTESWWPSGIPRK